MKSILLLFTVCSVLAATACKKDNILPGNEIPDNLPRTNVPTELRGSWMYGNFSMTEYWSQDPSGYLGNALEFAIAFKFNADGTYEQYFTSKSVMGGLITYQQSVTKGTVEIDVITKAMKTHPYSAHYKRTENGQTAEERDLSQSELNTINTYDYTTGTEPNGTKAIYLTLGGTDDAITFLQK